MKGVLKRLNNWHLRDHGDKFRKLREIDSSAPPNLEGVVVFYIVKCPKFDFPNARIVVPKGIEVYQAIDTYRNTEAFFFASKEEGYSPAYATGIFPVDLQCSKVKYNDLLRFPWYDSSLGFTIWRKLMHATSGSSITTAIGHNRKDPNPLLSQ